MSFRVVLSAVCASTVLLIGPLDTFAKPKGSQGASKGATSTPTVHKKKDTSSSSSHQPQQPQNGKGSNASGKHGGKKS